MDRCRKTGLWLVALMIGLYGLAGMAQGAKAQGSPLPTFKIPSPSQFDLTGDISVGPNSHKLIGTGSIMDDMFKQDLTFTPSSGPALTVNSVQSGMMYYFKMTGNDQWQMIDLSKTPGNVPNVRSDIPGFNGFNPNGGKRTYEAAASSQEAGKETINGTATTKYQADVDLVKLYTSLGVPSDQAAQIKAVSKMTLYLWVGDGDQTLYQQRVVLNSKAAGPGPALLDVLVDFTITYRDIGKPVTITAPANSVPYVPPAPTVPPMNPPGQASEPLDVVRAFVDAFNSGDIEKIRPLVAQGTRFIADPGTPSAGDRSFEEFAAQGKGIHVSVNNITQTAQDTVVVEVTITGELIPPLPHPYVSTTTIKVANGQITSFVEMTSEQTLRDLEVLMSAPQPGIPKTGEGEPTSLPAAMLALGLLLLACGALLRRS